MTEADLLFIHALTGLHPGSGTALGAVDLPVQRERHTQWPTIPGSSLKGVLRDAFERVKHAELVSIFGPDTQNASEHAGALSITDARLLAFPVRSAAGVFAWVTCPAVLTRLRRDAALLSGEAVPDCPPVTGETALVAEGSPLLTGTPPCVLFEEFRFTVQAAPPAALLDWIAERASDDAGTRDRLKQHLAIVGDDQFTHFARYATEVTARIALEYKTKTVRDGALFWEEFVPAETLFYAVAIAAKSRKANCPLSASDILDRLGLQLRERPIAQIGGDETVGKGLCALRLAKTRSGG